MNKYSPDCSEPLVNFQNSENVDFDDSACYLIAFMAEQVFEGPYSTMLQVAPVLSRLIKSR